MTKCRAGFAYCSNKLQALGRLLAIVSFLFIVLENVLDLLKAVSTATFSCLRIKNVVVHIIASGRHDLFVDGIFFHRFHPCQIVHADIGEFLLEHR